jgi:hypothetical protein
MPVDDYHAVSQQDASRLKLAKALILEADWPKSDEFACVGTFRSAGEFVCAPHGSSDWLDDLAGSLISQGVENPKPTAYGDLDSAVDLARKFRASAFLSKWDKSQLSLKLGAVTLGLLGWIGSQRPPIYVVSRRPFLVLYSKSKLEHLFESD